MMGRVSGTRLAVAGVVGVLGIGTVVGLAGMAGASGPSRAAPRSHARTESKTAGHESTGAVTTAHLNFSVALTGLASGAVTVTGSGQADLRNHAVSLDVNIPAALATLIPGGSATPETVQVVLSGDTVYADIPGLASLIGEPWISVALPSKTAAHRGADGTKLASEFGNVEAIVAFAQAHHATVTSLGSANVDGVPATGHKIVATLSPKGGVHTVTASLWSGASDRLLQADLTTSTTTPVGPVGISAVVDLTGYGAPVTISVPPPSQVKAVPLSMVEMLLGKGHGIPHL
jgi:hypothetical protein